MSRYVISLKMTDGCSGTDYYTGSIYTHQRERYPTIDNLKYAKRYESEKIAKRVADAIERQTGWSATVETGKGEEA